MKDKYIIPIFISHKGCPNQCTFCNQRKISGSLGDINTCDIKLEIEKYIQLYKKNNLPIEIAFFGGSFTGIELQTQEELLKLANIYIEKRLVESIRISTRPDYINSEILDMLKKYNVKTIELGIQSMDTEVLLEAKRGHTAQDVINACNLINNYKFDLGVQMMIGLNKSTLEKEIKTCKELINLNPKIARIYPVLVIKDTQLSEQYRIGEYKALSLDEAIYRSKEVLKLFRTNNVNVIRIGLQATDNISEGNDVIAGPFHPAFGELVESEIIYDDVCNYIKRNNINSQELKIYVNPKCVSVFVGNKRKNIIRIKEKFNVTIKLIQDNNVYKYNF